MKPKIRIFDSAFTPWTKSASLIQANKDVHPTHFEWTADDSEAVPGINVYTDGHIKDVDRPGAVAWLLEPPHLRPENYDTAVDLADKFDVILTYSATLLSTLDNAVFYPYGGSSIPFDKWGLYPKTKDVCMIFSDKQTMPGHKMRHEIARQFGDRIDLYGSGVGQYVDDKFEVLKDYRFAVVVESGRSDWYFTEKLIDCLAVGTIPIYWGCPDPHDFFDGRGVLPFREIPGLSYILDFFRDRELVPQHGNGELSYVLNVDFHPNDQVVSDNLETAKKYQICEDWFYEAISNMGDVM